MLRIIGKTVSLANFICTFVQIILFLYLRNKDKECSDLLNYSPQSKTITHVIIAFVYQMSE
jgi:hypothetical protein